jgi:hypothetical protein
VALADRPASRWRGPDAASYRVDVFGPGYVRVASSGVVRAQRWLPTAPLPRGELLTWKLTVTEAGGEPTIYPAVPAPPAVFQIAGVSEARAVEDARATGSHLPTGLAPWQAGAVGEAARELAALAAANPSSELARRLADSSARGAAALRPAEG